jgi:hypothetical protein
MAASNNLTPGQRQTRSRQASYTSWANTEDRNTRTAPGRAGMLRKFEERAKRAEAARMAFYTRLSMLGVKARRERAGGAARA